MTSTWIIPFLFMFTLLGAIIFSLVNKTAVDARKADATVPKSTLAKDGPQGGVAFLQPYGQTRARQHSRDVEPVIE